MPIYGNFRSVLYIHRKLGYNTFMEKNCSNIIGDTQAKIVDMMGDIITSVKNTEKEIFKARYIHVILGIIVFALVMLSIYFVYWTDNHNEQKKAVLKEIKQLNSSVSSLSKLYRDQHPDGYLHIDEGY